MGGGQVKRHPEGYKSYHIVALCAEHDLQSEAANTVRDILLPTGWSSHRSANSVLLLLAGWPGCFLAKQLHFARCDGPLPCVVSNCVLPLGFRSRLRLVRLQFLLSFVPVHENYMSQLGLPTYCVWQAVAAATICLRSHARFSTARRPHDLQGQRGDTGNVSTSMRVAHSHVRCAGHSAQLAPCWPRSSTTRCTVRHPCAPCAPRPNSKRRDDGCHGKSGEPPSAGPRFARQH